MTVARLPTRPETKDGLTYAQAMEIFERFFVKGRCQAAPTIAHQMGIPYDTVCRVLGGHVWPAAYRYWLDKVLP